MPPERVTRTSSSAATWWCGANMTPTQEMTASNDPSSYGSASASAVSQVEREPVRLGGPAPHLEQLGGEVRGHDVGAAAGGGQRGVARAGGDVQDPLAGR